MNNEKISPDFRLALESSKSNLEKSLDLATGYSEGYWDIIVRYIGNLEEINSRIPFSYTLLLANYAIITILEDNIEALSLEPSILYMDKPKKIYSNEENELYQKSIQEIERSSCFSNSVLLQNNNDEQKLTGKGIIIGVLDSGIDTSHPIFMNNQTKFLAIWDQTLDGNPPANFYHGTEYSNEISDYISNDISGHGTAVTGILASLAPEASILIVKLNQTTAGLIEGIDYVIRKAMLYNMPLIINLSYGNNYGDHAGNSILEDYINTVSRIYRISIIVGMGNDGNTNRHAKFPKMLLNSANTIARNSINQFNKTNIKEFLVSPFCSGINLQIWHNSTDNLNFYIVTPSKKKIGPIIVNEQINQYLIQSEYPMEIETIYGYPSPINNKTELYISIIPQNAYIENGLWQIEKIGWNEEDINLWLPVADSTSGNVFFLEASKDTTFTIPASAENVISVGSYDYKTLQYLSFSGRGYTVDNRVKPDISAPGNRIITADLYGGYKEVSGTSFSVPIVAAAVALIMEWGLVRGNDTFLYGEKLKAYLHSNARIVTNETTWPNNKYGYGLLCLGKSL